MVVWTLKDVAKALVQTASRGVKVEIVTASIDSQVAYILMNGGISFKNPNGSYHHKFMLVDNSILWNGSANWSMSAFSRTDDSVTILYNLKPAQLLFLEEAWQNMLKKVPLNDFSEKSLGLGLMNEIDEENEIIEYSDYFNPLIHHFDMRELLVN